MVFNIAIVGAGPAGCTLARLLLQSNRQIRVTIFEGETSLDFRSQGGTLDLHESTGQAALKRAGLFDEFLKFARYDGEAMKIADKKLLCYIKMGPGNSNSTGTGRPEIDRPQLRKLLYESLPEGTVSWAKKVTGVDESRAIHFADGTVANGFDLIIGADGAWSKIRPLLSSAKPFYSGIGGHSMLIPDAKKRFPELYDIVNRGSMFSFSDGTSIMAQYMSEGSINVATWAVRSETWQKEYDVHDAAAVRKAHRDEFASWDSRLLAFTQKCDDDVTPRDLYMLPIGHRWEHLEGVTLIGDAAHVMTPFAGEGVNLAMKDALQLADAIIDAAAAPTERKSRLDENVSGFERDMFQRATATQQMTFDMMNAMYMTPNAPRNGIEKYILRALAGPENHWTAQLLAPLVYAWFFVFKSIWH